MNRWTYGYGFVTLTRRPNDLPGIHVYGTGRTRKEAAQAWVSNWREAQAFRRRIDAAEAIHNIDERLAA